MLEALTMQEKSLLALFEAIIPHQWWSDWGHHTGVWRKCIFVKKVWRQVFWCIKIRYLIRWWSLWVKPYSKTNPGLSSKILLQPMKPRALRSGFVRITLTYWQWRLVLFLPDSQFPGLVFLAYYWGKSLCQTPQKFGLAEEIHNEGSRRERHECGAYCYRWLAPSSSVPHSGRRWTFWIIFFLLYSLRTILHVH